MLKGLLHLRIQGSGSRVLGIEAPGLGLPSTHTHTALSLSLSIYISTT